MAGPVLFFWLGVIGLIIYTSVRMLSKTAGQRKLDRMREELETKRDNANAAKEIRALEEEIRSIEDGDDEEEVIIEEIVITPEPEETDEKETS